MYTLTSGKGQSYNIVMRDREIGTVTLTDKEWLAQIGLFTYSSTSRKKAVEGLFFTIIMGTLDREKEKLKKFDNFC